MKTHTQESKSIHEEVTSTWSPEGLVSHTGEGDGSGWEGDLEPSRKRE